MPIESDPTTLARPSMIPLNGKTKIVTGGGGVSLIGAIAYLYYAMAQQPVINSQQDAEINRVDTKIETTSALIVSELRHMTEMNRTQHEAMLTAIRDFKKDP